MKDHEKTYSPFLLEATTPVWGKDDFNKYLTDNNLSYISSANNSI